MRLLVFVRETPSAPVHDIEVAAVNTGFKTVAGRLPNKGGLVVKLSIGATTLSFISCHLTAHEVTSTRPVSHFAPGEGVSRSSARPARRLKAGETWAAPMSHPPRLLQRGGLETVYF